VRRAKELRRYPEHIGEHSRTVTHFLDCTPRADPPRVRVRQRVIADHMTLSNDSARELRMPLRLRSDHEESRLGIRCREHIEAARRPRRIGPVIEREKDAAECRQRARHHEPAFESL
jgi:hypothetical protein